VPERLEVERGGVPETLLWRLYHRAVEARRSDAVLEDRKAIELVERIDYPFEERFGRGQLGQWQALRVRCFDREIRRFLATHPAGTVVALGEGLETQFWRVDNGQVRWVGVDVPETIALRARLLPDEPRLRSIASSALDERWMEEVDDADGVLVSAQGLLMYFERADVHRLIAGCAERFPGGALLFDPVPRWLSAASGRGVVKAGTRYRPPPWPWGIDAVQERRLAELHRNVAELRALRLPRGRGALHGFVVPLLSRVPALRRAILTVYAMRFGRPVR
jgi:O-methyltransferase involved in polyketide biosynthesis